MIFFYFLERIINKWSDEKFTAFWQKWIIKKPLHIVVLLILHYFLGVVIISRLILYGSAGLFLSFFTYIFTMIGYGALYTKQAVKLFLHLNERYMLQTRSFSNTDDFDKQNVVHTIHRKD